MRKKIIKILILIMVSISLFSIINAAYKTMLNTRINSKVTPWVIFVNNQNIASIEKKTFSINEVIKNNNNVQEGKIAPGVIIELPIEIDATKTQNMDIRYDIIVDGLKENQPNFKIMSVTGENLEKEIIRTDINKYTGIITKTEIENNNIHKLSVSVIWENDENYNELDTALGIQEERQLLNIPMRVNISQYGNEEILEYTEVN